MKRWLFGTASALSIASLVIAACSDDAADPRPTVDAAAPTNLLDASPGDADAALEADVAVALVDASARAVACAVTPCAVEIAAGAHSMCARMSDGTVRCWGANSSGELGRGTDAGTSASATPAAVIGLTDATQISGAPSEPGDAYCARRANGTAVCWGANGRGVLGRARPDGSAPIAFSPVPTAVSGITTSTGVFVGHSVACATDADAGVTCWGTNDAAQIPSRPLGDVVYGATTFALASPTAALAIADRGTVAFTTTGALLSWGLRGDALGPQTGVLGREVSLASAPPGPVDLAHVSAVSGNLGRVCANSNGRVVCWGAGPTNGSDSVYPAPIGIGTTLAFAQSIAVGPATVCAALSDGNAICWGNNAKGQLGNGNTDLQPSPVTVQGLAGPPVALAAMNGATCALLATGSVQCWGENDVGQLGLGASDALGHLQPKTVELGP